MRPRVSRSPCPPPALTARAVAPAPALRTSSRWREVLPPIVRGAGAFCRWPGQTLAALEDHWIGDLIGVAAIFGTLWLGLLFAHATGVSP